MQKLKKFLSLALALVIVFGAIAPAMAAETGEDPVVPSETKATTTKTVTLHKILMTKENLAKKDSEGKDVFPGHKGINGTEYDGNQITNITNYFGQDSKEIAGAYFALKYADGDNAGKFVTRTVAEDGTVTYGAADTATAANVVGGLTKDNGLVLNTDGLKGKFEIVEVKEESTYVGDNQEQLADSKAVPVEITLPLVNETGIIESTHVYPKNTEEKPQMDKNFAEETEGANDTSINLGEGETGNQREKDTVSRSIGDSVDYKVETKIAKGSKYEKLVWTDSMTKGLTYNKNLVVTFTPDDEDENFAKDTDYNLYEDDHGFRLVFTAPGLDKLEKLAATQDVTIRFEYSATINNDAVVDVADTNDIALDYSNKPGNENEPKEGNPSNQQIKVSKTWAVEGNEITEADKTVTATFILQEKQSDGTWKDVAIHEVTAADNFEHTFTDLDNSKTYRVIERVVGYEPEYVSFENGVVTIKNTKDSTNPTPVNPSEPKVVTYGKKFVKMDQTTDDRLAGAEFIIEKDGKYLARKAESVTEAEKTAVTEAKTALDDAVAAYNALTAEEQAGEAGTTAKATIDEKQAIYNKAVVAANNAYDWVEIADPFAENAITDNVVVLVSDAQGRFEIKGLAAGDDYNLVEINSPVGYAENKDPQAFTVGEGTYNGAESEVQYNKADTEAGYGQRVNNMKVTIPQTGGIGTIIFTVGGIALMGGAAVAMKKNKEEDAE